MSRAPALRASGPVLRSKRRGATARFSSGVVLNNKYQLVRQLGAGGMGDVWVARHLVLDVHVALKVMATDRGTHAVAAERMRQEARAAAQLGHPAICRLLDFGETERGDPYVVSELMHGDTLRGVLEGDGRLSATEAVRIMLPVIDALAVAHAHGIVHRDVKPENVFLSRDVARRLQPKLLDFGIARFVEADERLTLDGGLLGTPVYMSPEQARGETDADVRADIWAVCVVLYEAMTGVVPFSGKNYNAVLWAVATADPRPIMEHRAGDQALWRLLERGLRKDRTQRWQSMRELGEALALWLYESGVREDICGALLRPIWLEAGLSDVQVELPPSRRSPAQVMPQPDAEAHDRLTPIRIGRPVLFSDTRALKPRQPAAFLRRHPRSLAWAGLGAAVAVLGSVALWPASPREPEQRDTEQPRPQGGDRAPAAALSAKIRPSAATRKPTGLAVAASSPAAPATVPAPRPSATASSATPRFRPKRRRRVRRPPARAPRDFGF
jgi:serine/threonine protein kinase